MCQAYKVKLKFEFFFWHIFYDCYRFVAILLHNFILLLRSFVTFIFYVAFYSLFTLMQETLHMHNERVSARFDRCDVLEASSNEISEVENIKDVDRRVAPSKANLLKNWPLMSTIIVYCVFSLQEMAYTEVSIFSYWWLS